MRLFRTLLCAALLMAAPAVWTLPGGTAVAAEGQPSADEFVPMSEVPPEEQIPAFPLVAAAYGFVWVAVVAYVWSLGRRLQTAEQELDALERRGR